MQDEQRVSFVDAVSNLGELGNAYRVINRICGLCPAGAEYRYGTANVFRIDLRQVATLRCREWLLDGCRGEAGVIAQRFRVTP